jgi:hypothetical protein
MVQFHPQETGYEVSIDFEAVCIWFTMSCFSSSLSLFIYATDMIRDINKMKSLLCFCLDATDTRNKKMNDTNTEKLKGTLKKQK